MPKDPVRNIDRYKVRGGKLNEFDYLRQQTDLAREQGEQEQSDKIPIPSEQSRANRIKKLLHKYGESVPGEKKKKAIPKKTGAARKKSIAKQVKKAPAKAAKATKKTGAARKKSIAKPVKKAPAKAAKATKKSTAKAAARTAAKAASKKAAGKSPVRGKIASKRKSGTKGERA